METLYSTLADWVKLGGLLYFFGLFLGVLAYAFWPRNADKFKAAAQMPLRED